jgi:guanylate kinase
VLEHITRGIPTLLEIELQGARQVRRNMPQARLVFLSPPTVDALVVRLEGRATESGAELAARLEHARTEMAAAAEFDVVVVNDEVHHAARQVAALLLTGP